MMFRYDNLANHFQTNFALMQHHKYSLNELNDMMPWERTIYVSLLIKHMKEVNEAIEKQNRIAKRKR